MLRKDLPDDGVMFAASFDSNDRYCEGVYSIKNNILIEYSECGYSEFESDSNIDDIKHFSVYSAEELEN
jgi:hypothetical protein